MRRIALALASASALTALAPAQDFGPIETRNFRSLSIPFLRIDPRTPVLAKGERSLSVGFTAANDLRNYGFGRVAEDYELDRVLLRHRKGLGNGLDFTVDLPLYTRGGGFLDPLVEAWHDLVLDGFPSHGRAGAPFGRSYIRVPGASFGSGTGVGDVSVWLTRQMNSNLMLTGAVKVPTGNTADGFGSGNVDLALAAQWRVNVLRRMDLHFQGGGVFQGRATKLDSSRSLVHQAAVALTYQRSSRDNFVLQWQSEDSATVTGVGPSDQNHRMFSAAWQRRIAHDQTFEFFFSEDYDWPNWPVPQLANEAPDFTAGIRWTKRF